MPNSDKPPYVFLELLVGLVGIFIVVFALTLVVGFIARERYRGTMTTKCPHCRSQIDKSATVCGACGREVGGGVSEGGR